MPPNSSIDIAPWADDLVRYAAVLVAPADDADVVTIADTAAVPGVCDRSLTVIRKALRLECRDARHCRPMRSLARRNAAMSPRFHRRRRSIGPVSRHSREC